jgi:hypothetical protein
MLIHYLPHKSLNCVNFKNNVPTILRLVEERKCSLAEGEEIFPRAGVKWNPHS